MTWRPALWLVAVAVIVADQVTKQWALSALVPYEKHQVLGDVLGIQLVFNSGAAFSLGDQYTWVLTIVSVVVTGGIVYYARRARSRLALAIFGIGLGGAVGNLIDRLFRDPGFAQGHVVDMINYADFFVGNVADIAIVGAAAAVLVVSFTGHPLLAPIDPDDDATQDAAAAEPDDSDAPVVTADDAQAGDDTAADGAHDRG